MRVEISEKKEFIKMINQINPDFKLEKINGITVDSRTVKEHDIFIPIKGLLNDGHDYIENAINLGATILFSEKIIKQYKRPYKIIESNKKELMNLANLWINRFKPKIIAITGSNGKTTVKDLLYHIISKEKNIMKSMKNFNSTIGLPLSLFNLNKNHEIIILEMGADKNGEIESLVKVAPPNYAAITNINNAHNKYFGDIENIALNKMKIFKYLNKNDYAFINLDDIHIRPSDENYNKITFSFNESLSNFNGQLITSDTKYKININDTLLTLPYNSHTLAKNVLLCYSICSTLGISNKTIQNQLNLFNLPNGRGNLIPQNDILIIDDTYNANYKSFYYGIKDLLINYKNKRIIVIAGDMKDLGPLEIKEHKKLGALLSSKHINYILGIGSLIKITLNEVEFVKTKYFKNSYENLLNFYKKIRKKDDVLYLKASRSIKLEQIISKL